MPGHTPGSTAYLVRTPKGPVLLTGDASHTRWGWDHGVEPGTFSGDIAQSAVSFGKLQKLAEEQKGMDVRLGYQRSPSGQAVGPPARQRALNVQWDGWNYTVYFKWLGGRCPRALCL